MSELIQKNDSRATIRWKLLTGASALALTAYVSSTGLSYASDGDRPQIWIELGGKLNHLQDGRETYSPTLEIMRPSIFNPSEKFESPALYSLDEFAALSFRPENSDWVFSASIKYGHAIKDRHVRQQTYSSPLLFTAAGIHFTAHPVAGRFADTRARETAQHSVLDFQAGRDVGLGLFGENSSSTVSLGVRFAQFRDKSNISLKSDPDWHFQDKYFTYYGGNYRTVVQPYHSNAAGLSADRSFRGIGPSLSWTSSMPFAGNAQDGELVLDWGVNVAALFGRQKTRTQHHETVRYNNGGLGQYLFADPGHLTTVSRQTPLPKTRSRNVTVPNVGASVGLSWKLQDFKMSFGYKADFFFGAIDGGIDTAKKENRGFFGPYASISIGLGD